MACTILVAWDLISDVVFRDIIIGTVGVYVLGNSAESVGLAKKQKGGADASDDTA